MSTLYGREGGGGAWDDGPESRSSSVSALELRPESPVVTSARPAEPECSSAAETPPLPPEAPEPGACACGTCGVVKNASGSTCLPRAPHY